MIKLGIRDFQIIEKISLPLEGIVAITGPSNNGKTSVARAIEACLYNWSGDSFINDRDAESCTVGMVFPESQHHSAIEIVWEKPRGSGATYRVNGEVYTKTKGAPLRELMDEGFWFLETPRAKFKLNFWEQMGLFLVNESPSTTFDVLSRLLEDRKLLPVLKKMKDDTLANQKEAVKLEGQFQLLTSTLSDLVQERGTYDQFVSFQPKIIQVRNARDRLLRVQGLADQIAIRRQALAERETEFQKLVKPNDIVKASLASASTYLSTIDDLETLEAKRLTMSKISKEKARYATAKSVAEKIEKVNLQRVLTMENQSSRLQKLKRQLRESDTEIKRYEQLTETSKRLAVFESRLEKIRHLSDVIDRLTELDHKLEVIDRLQNETETDKQKQETEFEEFKIEAGVCPECEGTGFIGGHEHE